MNSYHILGVNIGVNIGHNLFWVKKYSLYDQFFFKNQSCIGLIYGIYISFFINM